MSNVVDGSLSHSRNTRGRGALPAMVQQRYACQKCNVGACTEGRRQWNKKLTGETKNASCTHGTETSEEKAQSKKANNQVNPESPKPLPEMHTGE